MNKITADGDKCYTEQDGEPRGKRRGADNPHALPLRTSLGRRHWSQVLNQKSSDTKGPETKSSKKPCPGDLLGGQRTE